MNYDSIKKLLWPHFLIPISAIVLIDYIAIIVSLIQIAAIFWLVLQVLSCAVGMWAGGMIKCTSGSTQAFWQSFFNYRLATFFPGLVIGKDLISWLLTETEAKPSSEPVQEPALVETDEYGTPGNWSEEDVNDEQTC